MARPASALTPTAALPDLSGWLLGHRAMRTEFGRLADLARDAEIRDPRRTAAVEQRLSFMHDLLHHHHTIEDELIWPFLRAANPDVVALCDDLEADHGVLHTLLEQMLDRERPLRARAGVLQDLHVELCRHLDREEGEGKPVIFDLVPAQQWEEWEVEVRRRTSGRQMATVVPWLLAHTTDEERARLFAQAPKLLELLLPPRLAAQLRPTHAADLRRRPRNDPAGAVAHLRHGRAPSGRPAPGSTVPA